MIAAMISRKPVAAFTRMWPPGYSQKPNHFFDRMNRIYMMISQSLKSLFNQYSI